ncbi:hypothetical protein KEM60_00080 [Austwickia sp. TVS 96-490-7B]|nr:hypothetical protein [Austwickia sp. TVS 96-490-7B]
MTTSLPERLSYRAKRRLLGRPLTNDEAAHEKLSNTLALGVLSSDCISSSAYGTEEILLVLLPLFGLASYDILMPMTAVILLILTLVTLCYRQVVMLYTQAGGSYVVARENFGPLVAQVAAVALMLDYIVTVAVQSAAGTDAVVSAIPALDGYKLEITVGVVLILFYGNLRGLREAGRAFAFPTYFFVASMGVVIVTGIVKELTGNLPTYDPTTAHGAYPVGSGSGLLTIGAVYILLKAFANGGSSLTGLEAISNGVSAFRTPVGPNARRTLVVMSLLLGSLVLGVSWLAHVTHAVPYTDGNPTVISQVTRAALGDSTWGHLGFYIVQAATCLILYTGANTPFNGFPFLANFVAQDGFLPRWLTKRGHRLAFSNGIVVLAVVALILLIGTGAHVDKLVAFYAIGVFTGFTLAGFGMAKHFLGQHADRSDRNRHTKGVLDFAVGCVAALVVVIFAVTKFTEGAWLVVVMFAVLVPVLLRLRRVYVAEARLLEAVPEQAVAPRASRSTIVVLVDTVDLAALRALSYAKSLRADEIRAVHVVLDMAQARRLHAAWAADATGTVPLHLVECPDRRLERSVVELVARIADERSGAQVTVILPRRSYGLMGRVLHDHTADKISAALSSVPGAVATIVPFDVRGPLRHARSVAAAGVSATMSATAALDEALAVTTPVGSSVPSPPRPVGADLAAQDLPEHPHPGATWIGQITRRDRVRVCGRVRSVQVSPIAGHASLMVELVDQTGGIELVFYGRREIIGIEPGVALMAEGAVGRTHGHLSLANPLYTLLPR